MVGDRYGVETFRKGVNMDRRDLLKVIGGAAALSAVPSFGAQWINNPHVAHYGASRPLKVTRDRKHFHNTFPAFQGVSGALEKNVFLYHNLNKQIGEIIPHDQRSLRDAEGHLIVAGEGDCIGQAAGMGCDVLAATDIHMIGQREEWRAKASVEMLYAGSRCEIGMMGLEGKPGSHGHWVAKFVNEYGVLHRLPYTDGTNSLDLTGYNPDRSRQYRDEGVPDWLEPLARAHPVKEITNVHTGQEALDAVCAGQPVLMCSSYAFRKTRDADGFCEPYLGMGWIGPWRWRYWGRARQWRHAMILTGAILKGKRKGGILQNSHGAWNSGPQPYGMPDGAFGVDLHILDVMVKDWFDCYALASYRGHEARRIRHQLYLR